LFEAFIAWVSRKIRSKGNQKQAQMELSNALQKVSVFTSKLHVHLNDKSEPEAAFEKVIRGGYLISSDNFGGVLMAETEANEYRLLVNDVCLSVARHFGKAKTADELHISNAAIESAIQSTVLKALDVRKYSTEQFEERLRTCLDELKAAVLTKPEPWLVRMEVRGLAAERLPYRFGEIEFYVAGSLREDDRTNSEGENPSEPPEKTKESAASARKFGNLFEPKKGAIYATVPVKASDMDAAKVLAERKLRVTLDALNFFGDFFEVLETKVSLPGDATVAEVKTFVWPVARPEEKHTSVGHTKQFLHFSFAAIGASSAKESGFDRVSSMLANSSASSLDERILSSLQWAGRASTESRREEAFLLFCISLEALLLGNRATEKTQAFALRGAHLQDAANREETFSKLKYLYGIRSSIVHSGRTSVIDADLSRIRWLAKTAVLKMLVREPFSKMKTEDELENWFQTQLLAGTVPTPQENTTQQAQTS